MPEEVTPKPVEGSAGASCARDKNSIVVDETPNLTFNTAGELLPDKVSDARAAGILVGGAVEAKRLSQGIRKGARGVVERIEDTRFVQVKWFKGSFQEESMETTGSDTVALRLGCLVPVTEDAKEKGAQELQVLPMTRALPDGASYQIAFPEMMEKCIDYLVFSSLYQLYLRRTPTTEELLVTKDTHLLVAKKNFKAGTLVLPPCVGSLAVPVNLKDRKQGHLSIEVTMGKFARNYQCGEPENSTRETDTETGVQLVCAPFWLAFKGSSKHEGAKVLSLRRGYINVHLESYTCKDQSLKTQRNGQKDNVLSVNLPYLVNAADINQGDVLFTPAL